LYNNNATKNSSMIFLTVPFLYFQMQITSAYVRGFLIIMMLAVVLFLLIIV